MHAGLESLLRALADGEPRSVERLARELGVARAAVSSGVAELERYGLTVETVRGGGYRLARAVDLLDARSLRAALAPAAAGRLARLEVLVETDSTNRRLLDSPPRAGELAACLAEFQSAGRGRRGRRWRTPLGAGLCLSVGAAFVGVPRDLPALGLAAGVVARRALAAACGLSVALKWPNDLVVDDRKLGGILVEIGGETRGVHPVVVGVGVNVSLPARALAAVCDWPRGAIDLVTALGRAPPPRALLAARLIDALAGLLEGYAASGFEPYRAEWAEADFLVGRAVALDDDDERSRGTAAGIDLDGALLIDTARGERRRVISGDVSVRSA